MHAFVHAIALVHVTHTPLVSLCLQLLSLLCPSARPGHVPSPPKTHKEVAEFNTSIFLKQTPLSFNKQPTVANVCVCAAYMCKCVSVCVCVSLCLCARVCVCDVT